MLITNEVTAKVKKVNPYSNAAHPIWAVIRLTVLMTTLVVVLFLTASKFDATELRTILIMFLTAGGVEGGLRLFVKDG